MDNSINNMDWENYRNLYESGTHPTVRTFHWSPLFYKTNNEYIFQPQSLADRVDEGFIGGEGAYGSSGSKVGELYANEMMGKNEPPKISRPEVIGYDVPYEQFIDISKPLNKQPEYVQHAINAWRNSKDYVDVYDFFDADGNLRKLPEILSPQWNARMDEVYPYGVLGIYDKTGYAGERNTYAYRHVKDMPKGYSAGKGLNIEPNLAPELFGNTPDSIEKITWDNRMKDVELPSIYEDYVNPVGIDTHLKESVPFYIKNYYNAKAENILSNTLSDENLKLMSRMELDDKINFLSRELMMDDYMKSHPEGLPIDKHHKIQISTELIPEEVQKQFSEMIDNILSEDDGGWAYNEDVDIIPTKDNEPKLSAPAKNITKQTSALSPKQVTTSSGQKVVTIPKAINTAPEVTNVPIGARLYDAKLNPKELVKIATDPKVLSQASKTLGKIATNPRTYIDLAKGMFTPENIAMMASEYLVGKASDNVTNRLQNKYNVKSQAEFNRLYPTLSAQERGQLGYTYPEMYQAYMRGK